MIDRLGLRSRLTILVTVVFAVAISITSMVVISTVEEQLVADTRASAETVLTSYLESVYGGTATVGLVDSDAATRFFYLDGDGNEISEGEYFELISERFDTSSAVLVGRGTSIPEVVGTVTESAIPSQAPVESAVDIPQLDIDPTTGELLDSTGTVVTFTVGPEPEGEPHSVDIGENVVGVAQTLSFADGTTFDVGVSSPLQPVTDSLDAIRKVLWLAVPALVLAIAAITWLAATRALRPVQAISNQVHAITAANITERVPVPRANDEIQDLASTMNDMLGRLESSQRRQHQLVSDVTHELRSPVAASRAQLEVAAANPASADWATTVATVLAEQEHLSVLIDDLLALSRLDESAPDLVREVDVDDLVLAEARRTHAVDVRTEIVEPVRVVGDPEMFGRAFRNLADNAARHASSDVLITLRAETEHAIVTFDDDGPGIPSEQHERIFDRFTRLDEARNRDTGGAGLGLAIARKVATTHGGSLVVSRSPLGGARFTLTLPRCLDTLS